MRRRRTVGLERELPRAREGFEQFGGLSGQLHDVVPRQFHREWLAGVEPRQIEQVADESSHPIDGVDDGARSLLRTQPLRGLVGKEFDVLCTHEHGAERIS